MRSRFSRRRVASALGILTVGWCLWAGVSRWQTATAIREIIDDGRLAPLPAEATDIRASSEGGLFTGSLWLRFHASQDAINHWLHSCPEIADQVPEVLPVAARIEQDAELSHPTIVEYQVKLAIRVFDSQHGHANLPAWHRISSDVRGREYRIGEDPRTPGHNMGWIIIDDVNNLVYVTVWWS